MVIKKWKHKNQYFFLPRVLDVSWCVRKNILVNDYGQRIMVALGLFWMFGYNQGCDSPTHLI